jgi:hypothetical protein
MERLENELRRTLGAAGVPDAGVLAEVVRAWPAAAGETIARFAWPSRIARDGTLHVATASSTWAFELTRLAAEIQTKLGAAVGPEAPTSIRFAPGPLPSAGPPDDRSAATAAAPQPSAEEERLAAQLAAAIDDEGLRETVRRAAAASLAGRHSGRSFWYT